MKLTWHGHSVFRIKVRGGAVATRCASCLAKRIERLFR
jgi:hypothetical protein